MRRAAAATAALVLILIFGALGASASGAAAADGRIELAPPPVTEGAPDGSADHLREATPAGAPHREGDWVSGVRAACAAAWSAGRQLDRAQVADAFAPFLGAAGGRR